MSVLRCERCGDERKADGPESLSVRCRRCGGLCTVEHTLGESTAAELKSSFAARRGSGSSAVDRSGVWRFRELVLPSFDPAAVVTLEEGRTPLLESPALAAFADLDGLRFKHEGFNPTASFKDRGMTVAVSHAVSLGMKALACASTGNTSASLAAYAARCGCEAWVLLPRGKVAMGKLAQTRAYGARVVEVEGDFDACLRLLEETAEACGVYVANSLNPFRLEGQKTIVFELLEQLDWVAPDWIALPAGNLGNTAAFGKALVEARGLGLIARMPRLLAVQAAGAAPFAASFEDDFKQQLRLVPETVASAIRIGDPASFDRAVSAIRATGGRVSKVSDAEILEAKRAVDRAGIGCEPASAASLAGLRQARRQGVILPGETAVAVLTAHLLKDAVVDDSDLAPIVRIAGERAALEALWGGAAGG